MLDGCSACRRHEQQRSKCGLHNSCTHPLLLLLPPPLLFVSGLFFKKNYNTVVLVHWSMMKGKNYCCYSSLLHAKWSFIRVNPDSCSDSFATASQTKFADPTRLLFLFDDGQIATADFFSWSTRKSWRTITTYIYCYNINTTTTTVPQLTMQTSLCRGVMWRAAEKFDLVCDADENELWYYD